MTYFFCPQVGHMPISHGTSSVLVILGHPLALKTPIVISPPSPNLCFPFLTVRLLLSRSFHYALWHMWACLLHLPIEEPCCRHGVSETRFSYLLPQLSFLERKGQAISISGFQTLSCVVWHKTDKWHLFVAECSSVYIIFIVFAISDRAACASFKTFGCLWNVASDS